MTDWAIPQQAKLKYTQLFNLHDRTRGGFLSGLQCRDILLQSGLPRKVLAEIWNLSDVDGDGQLTREEFILAMHLTNHVRSGQSLPTELPADLVPPSYRRHRSISATSIHSATSVGSSPTSGNNDDQLSQKSTENIASAFAAGSVLNSNSFEDKRRENFEKGRAELERRRLKIIEQQSVGLRDQLVASKKLVTEAKSKIDAMRNERDTKMGLITSLEAQLKTLRDRKAYLNQEELSLIAIAKDLNLVNPAQAELDQLATQAKQESINRMKDKLDEFVKKTEEMDAEVKVVNERVEESKSNLKSLTEIVTKTYENYKEKIAEAKLKRQQFVDEAKSQTPDLDSVWNSSLSFGSQATSNNPVQLPSGNASEDPWAFKPSTDIQPVKLAFSPQPNNNDVNRDSFLHQRIRKFKALYAFEARNPDELTIEPGDIIVASEEVCEPGWLSGETNGRHGLFPEAYVESLVTEEEDTAAIESDNTETNRDSLIQQRVRKFKALYAFEARNPDELTIEPGDIIVASEETCEPGWLSGETNGRSGLFPEAYVESIPFEEKDNSAAKTRAKRNEVATVIANYKALGQEQLNLEKGQLVLVQRKMDSGWWKGEIQVKGKKKQSGWFPASYVKLLSSAPQRATRVEQK